MGPAADLVGVVVAVVAAAAAVRGAPHLVLQRLAIAAEDSVQASPYQEKPLTYPFSASASGTGQAEKAHAVLVQGAPKERKIAAFVALLGGSRGPAFPYRDASF